MAVYISHSRENASVALKLCDALSNRGIQTWLDVRDLDVGSAWDDRIAQAIQASDAWLFLIGPGANDRWQRFEWQQVVEQDSYLEPSRALIPVVIGDADVPGFLNARQFIQVDPAGIDFEALAAKVATALGKPEDTIDADKLERGRAARDQALKNLREYGRSLEERDVKQAGLRGLK